MHKCQPCPSVAVPLMTAMSTETGTATSFLRLTDTSIVPLSSVTFILLGPSNPTVTVSSKKDVLIQTTRLNTKYYPYE